jgi:hypothetical protein
MHQPHHICIIVNQPSHRNNCRCDVSIANGLNLHCGESKKHIYVLSNVRSS